jgi:tRNA(fMet)-specific endonuclease VapC
MLVLDTDHWTEYQRGVSAKAHLLKDRLDRAVEPIATTIITVEEIMRGWLAAVRRVNDPRRQINAYAKLRQLFRVFGTWNVLDWTDAAVDEFLSLKRTKARVGTMDLKIASIAIANNATLLTRNINDFGRIPNVHIEDWLSWRGRGGKPGTVLFLASRPKIRDGKKNRGQSPRAALLPLPDPHHRAPAAVEAGVVGNGQKRCAVG